MATYDTVLQAVQTRVNALVAKSAGLSEADAVAKVFRDDPALYTAYREAAGRQPARRDAAPARRTSTPSGAEAEALTKATALVAKRADLSITDALMQVFRDDGTLYERYRKDAGQVQAAELEVTETRTPPHPLADDLLALAKAFRPQDPTGAGMVMVRQALHLLQQTVEHKTRVAA
jgi:hypothetical protein